MPLLSGCATLVRTGIEKGEQENQPRNLLQTSGPFEPFRGVFHVHTVYSHDSKADLEDVRKAARKADLDFVIITDHNTRAAAEGHSAAAAAPPLLIIGEEISTGDGHLISIGTSKAPSGMSSSDLIRWIHEQGGYAILAHPTGPRNRWRNTAEESYDGLEVYNFANSIYNAPVWKLAFAGAFYTPGAFMRAFQKEPPYSGIEMWDRQLQGRRSAAVGAVDAHIHFEIFGFAPESLLLMFRAVTMHVYAERLDKEAVAEAVGKGRSFIAFETKGRADGFLFKASAGGKDYLPGDTVSSAPVRLEITAPEGGCYLRLIHNGAAIAEQTGDKLEITGGEPGYYRAEVYKDGVLWILSNPIYVQ